MSAVSFLMKRAVWPDMKSQKSSASCPVLVFA